MEDWDSQNIKWDSVPFDWRGIPSKVKAIHVSLRSLFKGMSIKGLGNSNTLSQIKGYVHIRKIEGHSSIQKLPKMVNIKET